MKRKIIVILMVFVILLGFLSQKPVVSYKTQLSPEYKTAIESQSKGVYSSRLPLVPVFVSVEPPEQEKAFYTIYYFPFGTVDMSYSPQDGYNIEKQLSRI